MSNSELADVSLEPPSKQNNEEIPLDLETPTTSELNDVNNNTNKLDDKLTPPELPPKDNETPPPMPARPSNSKFLSQIDLTINQLIEMFPETDLKFIKMALIASEGRLEPASNALLFLSDPNSGIEIPNPNFNNNMIDPINQLESDEALARSLAKSYEKGNNSKSYYNHKHISPSMKKHHSFNNNLDDKDFDDEDDIYDSFTKNVTEAKQIVGGWFDNISKKIQGSIDQPQQQQFSEYSNYSSQKPIGNQNPYQKQQQQQSIQKGYGLNENNNNDNDDVPKLPPRRSANTLYPAVNHSDTSVNLQTQIKLSDSSNESPPNPVEKDDSYISNSIQKPSNKKSNLNTENEKSNEQLKDSNSKSDKKWSPLKEAEPEPSNDAFLVEDSEDDDNDNK
jgi:hypothetical protein